ncbi:MAG: hypothetical protein JO257_01840 [Deltaproteobacteria bacterium]|nr:hypothetical protein [Deltaproteobacteria bacterium]
MRTLLFGLALSLAAVTGCNADKTASADKAKDEFPALSMDDVQKGIEGKTLTAVDCNGDRTRKKLGTLPGAIVVSDEESFEAKELPADKATKLVFYCANPG